MLTLNIKLNHCLEMFVDEMITSVVFDLINEDKFDDMVEYIREKNSVAKTVMFLPVAKELREAISLDIWCFSKEPLMSNESVDVPCIFYHHGFCYGTVQDMLDALNMPYTLFKFMDAFDFEDEYLGSEFEDEGD